MNSVRNPQILLLSNFFIKIGSHITIHIFKNYFVTVFSVFSFQFQQNKFYPNRLVGYKLTNLDVSMLEWLVLLKPLYSWVSIPVVIVPAKEKRKTLVFTFERLKDDLSAIVYAVSVNSIDKIFDG